MTALAWQLHVNGTRLRLHPNFTLQSLRFDPGAGALSEWDAILWCGIAGPIQSALPVNGLLKRIAVSWGVAALMMIWAYGCVSGWGLGGHNWSKVAINIMDCQG